MDCPLSQQSIEPMKLPAAKKYALEIVKGFVLAESSPIQSENLNRMQAVFGGIRSNQQRRGLVMGVMASSPSSAPLCITERHHLPG